MRAFPQKLAPSQHSNTFWLSSSGPFSVSSVESLIALIPVTFLALIWVTFWVSPNFYFTYMLEEANREYQVIEILTFLSAALAGGILIYVTHQLWERHSVEAALWVGVLALATIFFAGEEISWGQSYFKWDTPQWWGDYISRETNFHNSRVDQANSIRLTHWGGVFLLAMFVIFPILWRHQDRIGLSLNLGPAMPDFGSSVTIVVASLYRESKSFFVSMLPAGAIYDNFLWGISEHREMIVAIGLLIYAITRWKVIRNPTF